jgi:PAS domain S-box-containing protein
MLPTRRRGAAEKASSWGMRITTRLWVAFGALVAVILVTGWFAQQHSTAIDEGLDSIESIDRRPGSAAYMRELHEATGTIRQTVEHSYIRILLGLAVGVLVGGAGALVIRKRIAGPVATLLEGVERIGAGELDHRIPHSSGDELGELAIAVNRMGVQREGAERELQRLSKKNALILQSAGEGIFGLDVPGRTTFVNDAALRMTGFAEAELMGREQHDLIHHSRVDSSSFPREECPILMTLRDGQVLHVAEDVFWRKDGSSFPVEYTSTPIWEGERVTGAVVVFRDISERREVARMKDEFISVVSHELRTPLTALRGSLGLLAGGMLMADPSRGQRMLDIAVTNTDRLIRLINDMLDLERMESGRVTMDMKVCSAGDLMSQAIEDMQPLAAERGIVLELEPLYESVWADPDRMLQTFTNLISNAVKFSPWGSMVTMSARRIGEEIRFCVQDRGRGIPQEKIESIFGRFQQVEASDSRQKGGTGLGLAICRMIVEQHEGRIWAESRNGEGSTFYFTLPALERETVSRRPLASIADDAGLAPVRTEPGGSALLIEGDVDLADVLAVVLRRHDLVPSYARTAKEAMSLARSTQPDLVLLDLSLPEGNGFDLVRWMREHERFRFLPLIVYCTRELSEAEKSRLRLGPTEFLTKGVTSVPELEHRLEDFLARIVRGQEEVRAS